MCSDTEGQKDSVKFYIGTGRAHLNKRSVLSGTKGLSSSVLQDRPAIAVSERLPSPSPPIPLIDGADRSAVAACGKR